MHVRIWLAIGVAALGWGTSSPAARAALGAGVPPVALATIRSGIAIGLLLAILFATGRSFPRTRQLWTLGAVMGSINLALPFVATTIALQYASSGFVGLLIALVPMGTAVVAHFLIPHEPLYAAKVIGLLIAFAGVGFLLFSGDSGIGEEGRPLLAAGLTVLAVAGISYGSVFAKQRQAHFDPVVLSTVQFVIGFGLMLPVMLVVDGPGLGFTAWAWMLIVYLTVAGSVVPFLLYYWVLQRTTTTHASLTAYVVPLIALISGIIFLDERLELGIGVGGALILAGVIYLDRSERRRTASATRARR